MKLIDYDIPKSLLLRAGFIQTNDTPVYKHPLGHQVIYTSLNSDGVFRLITARSELINLKHRSLRSLVETLNALNG